MKRSISVRIDAELLDKLHVMLAQRREKITPYLSTLLAREIAQHEANHGPLAVLTRPAPTTTPPRLTKKPPRSS